MTVRVWGVAALAGAAALAATTRPLPAQPLELPAIVVTLTGRAEMFKKGDTAWKPAELRAEIGEGDGVRTPPGVRATLRTGGGHAVRLAALSQAFFLPPDGPAPDQPVRVRMDRGWLWIAVASGAHVRAPVEVRIGPTRIAVLNGGVGFRLGRDGAVLIRVYHGVAKVVGSQPAWERNLHDEQELLVGATGAPADIRKLSREPVEELWVQWNEEQDYAAYGGKPPR